MTRISEKIPSSVFYPHYLKKLLEEKVKRGMILSNKQKTLYEILRRRK